MVQEENSSTKGSLGEVSGSQTSGQEATSLSVRRARLRGSLAKQTLPPDPYSSQSNQAVNVDLEENQSLGSVSSRREPRISKTNNEHTPMTQEAHGLIKEEDTFSPPIIGSSQSSPLISAVDLPEEIPSRQVQALALELLSNMDQSMGACATNLATLQKISGEQTEALKVLTETLQNQTFFELGLHLNSLMESLSAALEPMKAVGELVPVLGELISTIESKGVATDGGAVRGVNTDQELRRQVEALKRSEEELLAVIAAKEQSLQAMSGSNTEVEELNSRLEELTAEIKARDEDNQELKSELKRKLSELAEKESETQQLRAQMEELREQTQELVADLQKQFTLTQKMQQSSASDASTSKSLPDKNKGLAPGFFDVSPASDLLESGPARPLLREQMEQFFGGGSESQTNLAQAHGAMPMTENVETTAHLAESQTNLAQAAAMGSETSRDLGGGGMAASIAAAMEARSMVGHSQSSMPASGISAAATSASQLVTQTPVPLSQMPIPATPFSSGLGSGASSGAGSYGSGVRAQVFEVIVRQALAGAPWREICAGPMQVNNISPDEVETEVKRRQALLKK